MARRKIPPIPEDQVRKLAERGWSGRAIAAQFGVDERTIRRKFAAVIAESKQHGAAKLLDVLWKRATEGRSDRVLVHLADRIIGPVVKKIEITKEQAIEFLEKELEQDRASEDRDDSKKSS